MLHRCWPLASCCFAVLCLTLAVCGCGGSDRPPVTPVSGSVSYNGQPVAGATVVFLSQGSDPAARAVTGSDGTFQLSTFDEYDGAVAGKYSVTVVKMEGGEVVDPNAPFDPVADMAAAEKNSGAAAAPAKSLLPEKYSLPATSGLEFTVESSGANKYPITLTD